MTEAEAIAKHAGVDRELAELVVAGAAARGLQVREVRGEARRPELVAARCSIIGRARAVPFSDSEIGRALRRDHSTIMHHARAIAARGLA